MINKARRLLIALAIALLPSIALAQGQGGGGMSGGGHMGGGGMSGGHFAGHSHFVRHHRAFDLLPLDGDYGAVPPSESDDDNVVNASPPETVAGAPEPTPARSCSQQAVTVPSEAGGTRQITILRC
jgi:hypothetical protein